MDTKELDAKYLIRSGEPFPLEVKRQDEFYLYDEKGRKYIDFLSGWCVGNLGWQHKELVRVIHEYEGPTYVYPNLLYRPWAELAELLASIAPGRLTKCYRTTGGSESVDTAMQIAMAYTGKEGFLSLEGSYHGNIISTVSIGDKKAADEIENHLKHCGRVSLPLDHRALEKIEERLKIGDTAAFIMEPVICNLGVVIPDKKFMEQLSALCRRYDTLLVMDEVACGFGRTGKMFASEHFNIEPDVLCLSKAITAGHAGLGATMTTEEITARVKDKVSVYSTYGWHPLATQVALATIRFMLENKVPEHAQALSGVFTQSLSKMKFRSRPKVKAIGLAIGVEFDDEDYPEKIRKDCLKEGLLLVTQGKNVMLLPPLTMKEETVHEGLEIIKRCI